MSITSSFLSHSVPAGMQQLFTGSAVSCISVNYILTKLLTVTEP